MICLACNFIIENGSKFCGNCGKKVELVNSCPECKIINPKGSKFCGGCGLSLINLSKSINTDNLDPKDYPGKEDTTSCNNNNVSSTNTKKIFKSFIAVIIYLVLCLFVIPGVFVGLNFIVYNKPGGAISAIGFLIIINLTVFGFANLNIASSNKRTTSNFYFSVPFWLGLIGPLGTIITLMLNVKPTKNKILLGIVRFISFAIVLQIFREVSVFSQTTSAILSYLFGVLFALRGKKIFSYNWKSNNINNKLPNTNEKLDSKYIVDRSKSSLTNFDKSKSFLIEYFSKRKKNIALYLLVVHFIKVLIHFFVVNSNTIEAKRRRILNGFGSSENIDFIYLIENIYSQKLIIFIPSFFIVSFFIWYFNDKINAK